MRCRICDKADARHYDRRDQTYLCSECKEDIQEVLYEWQLEDDEDEKESKRLQSR